MYEFSARGRFKYAICDRGLGGRVPELDQIADQRRMPGAKFRVIKSSLRYLGNGSRLL